MLCSWLAAQSVFLGVGLERTFRSIGESAMSGTRLTFQNNQHSKGGKKSPHVEAWSFLLWNLKSNALSWFLENYLSLRLRNGGGRNPSDQLLKLFRCVKDRIFCAVQASTKHWPREPSLSLVPWRAKAFDLMKWWYIRQIWNLFLMQ